MRRNKMKVLTVLFFLILVLAVPVFAEGEGTEVNFGWISILPPLLAIVLAFVTEQVLLSLFLGIFLGATMLNGWNPVVGFLRSIDKYIVGSLADPDSASVIIFLLAIGGLIGLVNKMGGTLAVAEGLGKKINNPRSAQLFTWLLGILVFFDDYANALIVGPTMSPLTDKNNISKEKLSYIIDSTAAPITGLAIVSTWVGYMVGVITETYNNMGMEVNGYSIFLKTIPYMYYCIFSLLMVLLLVLTQKDFGPMYEAEKRARLTGKLVADDSNPMSGDEIALMEIKEGIELKAYNAIIPIVTLIVVVFIGIWYTGAASLGAGVGFKEAFSNGDSFKALLWGSLTASLVAIVMGVAQKIYTVGEAFDTWMEGAKSMVIACTILVLAWSIGSVTSDVGTARFLVGAVSGAIPAVLLPVIVFIIAGLISIATGTAWGTMAIVTPLALPLAESYIEMGADPIMLIITLSTVLSGAILGDHVSPISDTTIMSSMAAGSDHLDHVKTQMPYAMVVSAISIICYFISGLIIMNPIIILLIGGILVYLVIHFKGKSVAIEDLKKIEA
jgi:Na+/H+ antiporter NhaC